MVGDVGPASTNARSQRAAQGEVTLEGAANFSRDQVRESVRTRLFGTDTPQMHIGRFVVLERLGRGGMGAVYRARDPVLERDVALKLLHDDRLNDHVARARMVREARTLARLNSPNVVSVYDVGEADGRVFLAMELVEGRDLRRWIAAKPRSADDIITVFLAAAAGLSAIHAAGLVHRDFKPENVLIGDDESVRVADFGLARVFMLDGSAAIQVGDEILDDTRTLTRTGCVVGTPAYMAPELAAGRHGDARGDVFAFAVALFEALYGRRPFLGRSLREVTKAAMAQEIADVPRPRRRNRALYRVVVCGLAARPDDRWQTIEEFAAALRSTGTPRRRRWIAVSIGAVALSAAVGLLGRPGEGEVDPCEALEDSLESVWGSERRTQINTAVASIEVPFATTTSSHVAAKLDVFATDWSGAANEVCRAPDDPRYDARLACLRRRLAEVAALTDALVGVSASGLIGASDAVDRLASPARCATDPVSISADVSDADEDHLRRARLAAELGDAHGAVQIIDALLANRGPEGGPGLVASALYIRGVAKISLDNWRAVVDDLEGAYHLAQASGDVDLALAAADDLAFVVGHDLSDTKGGRRWLRAARALIERGATGTSEMALAASEAAIDYSDGRPVEALSRLEAAIEKGSLECPDCATMLDLHAGAANVLVDIGQARSAVRHAEREVDLARRIYGQAHPRTLVAESHLAKALAETTRTDEAIALLERLRIDLGQVVQPSPHLLLSVLDDLGNLLVRSQRRAEGIAVLEEAATLARSGTIGSAPLAASALYDLARAYLVVRDPRAISVLQEVKAMLEVSSGPESGVLVGVLSMLAYEQARTPGMQELAVATIDEAMAIAEGSPPDNPGDAVLLRWHYAFVVRSARPTEARVTFESVLAQLEVSGSHSNYRASGAWYLAQVCYELGDSGCAERRSAEALALTPNSEQARRDEITTWRRMHRWL